MVEQVLLYKYVGQLQLQLNLFQINSMSTHGRIEGRIERLYKLLDKADKIYPRYLKNSKNSRRLNTVIRKLHKKLNKLEKT